MNIKEIKYLIQSANINFMIGSGISRPYLATLGSIEIWLTHLYEDMKTHSENEYKIVEASIYKAFYEKVIAPNKFYDHRNPDYLTTKGNYKKFLIIWNNLLNKRYSRILNKQINLFTTNVDLMIEDAASGMGLELNDGFRGSVKAMYDEANFMKSVSQTSLHFQHTSEIPVFNLLKIHGSINWKESEKRIENNILWSYYIGNALKVIDNDKFINPYETDADGNIMEKAYNKLIEDAKKLAITDVTIYNDFINNYKKLIIVNPTKRKFVETVMDYHFYELMRIYSNALEKENSILFVIGFSFADEHIATLTRRAAESNPTLKIIVFVFCDAEEAAIKKNLGIGTICVNNNIAIITPADLKGANKDDEYKELMGKIEYFDMATINEIFEFMDKMIHANYE